MKISLCLSLIALPVLLAQSPSQELWPHVYNVVPEVRAALSLEILATERDPKSRREILDLLESTAPQLELLYPQQLIRGSNTDRPSGFRDNASRLRITRSDVYSVLASEYAATDLDRAEALLESAHALLNRPATCDARAIARPGEFLAAFVAYWRRAEKSNPKRRREALDWAAALVARSTQSELSFALAKTLAVLGQPLDQWLAAFADGDDTNRNFFESWIVSSFPERLEIFEKAGLRREFFQAFDRRVRKQSLQRLCQDHLNSSGNPSSGALVNAQSWRQNEQMPLEPYRWLPDTIRAQPEPVYHGTPEASEIFELGRQMRHDSRLKLGAPTEQIQAALAEAIVRAKRIAAWPGDPSLPKSYLSIQRIYFLNALIHSLPPQEEFRFPIVDILAAAYSQAFTQRDAAPIAVSLAINFLERLSEDPAANASMLEKIQQMPDPNIRALATLVQIRKKLSAR
jgi:hypothetical protein